MAVQLNDTIEIPASGWDELVEVEWTQNMKPKKAQYYQVSFKNTTDSSREQGKDLFIQEEKADELKKAGIEKDGKIVLTVTSDFLHGQGKDGKNRWLVYHDQARNPFQHRFSQGVLKKYLLLGTDAVKKMGFYDLKGITDIVGGLVGDPLRKM